MANNNEQGSPSVAVAFQEFEQLHRLTTDAKNGDEQSRTKLSDFLERTHMWSQAGNVAQHAVNQWILTIVPNNCPELIRSIKAKLAELWTALGGPNGTTLERLLIQRILVCWLQTHHADVAFAAAHRMHGISEKFMRMANERVETCQRSYLRAIRELAVIRRLQPVMIKAKIVAATQDSKSGRDADRSEAADNSSGGMTKVELAEVMKIYQGKERTEDFPPPATPDVLSTKLPLPKWQDDGLVIEGETLEGEILEED